MSSKNIQNNILYIQGRKKKKQKFFFIIIIIIIIVVVIIYNQMPLFDPTWTV